MKQQFKLKKAGYYKAVIRHFTFLSIFLLFFAAIMYGVFYFTGTEFKKSFTLTNAIAFLPFWGIFLFQFLEGWYKAKVTNKRYKISFCYDYILIEQVAFWDQPFFSGPNISQRRLYYKEITEIRKSNTGYYTLKGLEDSNPNTLIISADIENINGLEETLAEIKPIKLHSEVTNLEEFPVTEDVAQNNHWHQIFSLKNIGMILGCYAIFLLISYFWFNPINWPLTLFLSIIYFSFMLLLIPVFIKRYNQVFPIILDNTAVIVERAKGNPVAMPFNEITAIRKKNFQFFITGKKISTSFPNYISFPTFVKDSNTLEQKLNTIQPIVDK